MREVAGGEASGGTAHGNRAFSDALHDMVRSDRDGLSIKRVPGLPGQVLPLVAVRGKRNICFDVYTTSRFSSLFNSSMLISLSPYCNNLPVCPITL